MIHNRAIFDTNRRLRLGEGTPDPYLLQHADNPVNCYPWGDEAFETARTEDKPVLVSIGYSICHWCHVMANESPHFEKMLYDNAQLIRTYVDAYELTGDETFAAVAKASIEYVLRDMTHPEGGFYSAEDADSVYVDVRTADTEDKRSGKKAEGGFYVWQHDEIMHILKNEHSDDDFGVFAFYYGIKPEGNVSHDPLGEFKGKNILYRAGRVGETAGRTLRASINLLEKQPSAVPTLLAALGTGMLRHAGANAAEAE